MDKQERVTRILIALIGRIDCDTVLNLPQLWELAIESDKAITRRLNPPAAG
jgi:hypothetical protein